MRGARWVSAVALAVAVLSTGGCTGGSSYPTHPKDYLADGCYSRPTPTVGGDGYWLSGPHFDLRFAGSDVEHLDNDLHRPAPGYELLCLANGPATGAGSYTPGRDDKVSARVLVDGATRPLAQLPESGLVVSVPAGHNATLQVTDDGRTQSLDIRTGRRGDDAIAGYYRPRTVKAAAGAYHGAGRASHAGTRLTVEAWLSLDQLGGSLQPWVPSRGWAPPGRSWLVLSGLRERTSTSLIGDNLRDAWALFATFAVQDAPSFVLTPPGGGGLHPEPTPPHADGEYQTGIDLTLEFTVPDPFTGGDLLYRPQGRVFVRGDGGDAAVPFAFSTGLAARHVSIGVS